MAKVTMPQLGESVAEGTIGKWLKQPGDHVAKYEPLVEVITDKVNAEVPSPFEGTLTEILVEEGATVPNDAEIAIIDTPDEGAETVASASSSTAAVAPAEVSVAQASSPAETTRQTPAPASAPAPASVPAPVPVSASTPATAPGSTDARMTPAVRRLLREHGLAPEQVVGTGGGGRITRDDVTDLVEALRTGTPVGAQSPTARPSGGSTGGAATAPKLPPLAEGPTIVFPEGTDEVLVPPTQMRKGIAAQMTRALAVPHAYVQVEIDVTNLVRLRESAKREFQAREGVSLSYVPFVIKASVEALKRHPSFNAHWSEAGLVAKRRVNVGVAVAVDDGLIVPVVRDVDQLSISGINRAIADVAARARAGKLRVDDFGGGTFTVDNTGWFGSNMTMPIINVPEVAILTMEVIRKRPVVVETEDGDVIAIRPIMNMVIGIDHRANDGAQAGYFLRDVKAWLEGVGPDTAIF